MLARDQRLTDAAGFARAVRRGRRAGGELLVVHLGAAPDEAAGPGGRGARIGFVVSKAVGNAVVRNRVRRRLRHLSRERFGALPDASVCVVRAQPAAAGATYGELGAELDRCLDRVVGTVVVGTAVVGTVLESRTETGA